jgi:hypothetical protein
MAEQPQVNPKLETLMRVIEDNQDKMTEGEYLEAMNALGGLYRDATSSAAGGNSANIHPPPPPSTPPQSTPVEAEHTLPDTLVVTEPQSVIVHQQAQPDDPHTSANIPKSLDKPRKSR